MERPASSVRSPVPALPDASTAFATVMSLLAWRVTFAPSSAVTIVLGAIVTSVPAVGWEKSAGIGSAPAFATVMFLGSRSSVPLVPAGALRSALPRKTRASLPDTSAKPPFPPSAPPRAESAPSKRVPRSDHTTTLPPSPATVASAAKCEAAST